MNIFHTTDIGSQGCCWKSLQGHSRESACCAANCDVGRFSYQSIFINAAVGAFSRWVRATVSLLITRCKRVERPHVLPIFTIHSAFTPIVRPTDLVILCAFLLNHHICRAQATMHPTQSTIDTRSRSDHLNIKWRESPVLLAKGRQQKRFETVLGVNLIWANWVCATQDLALWWIATADCRVSGNCLMQR